MAPERPIKFQVQLAIDVIRKAASYSSNEEEMSLVINKLENLFTEDRIASKKQINICEFFKPV